MKPHPHLLESLVCPITKTPLIYNPVTNELFSVAAKLAFPIHSSIPLMVVEAARPLTPDEIKLS